MRIFVCFVLLLFLSSCALNLKRPHIIGGDGEWIYLGWTIYGGLAVYKTKMIGVGGSSGFSISGLPDGVYSVGLIVDSECDLGSLIFKTSIYNDEYLIYKNSGSIFRYAKSYYGLNVNEVEWGDGLRFFNIYSEKSYNVNFSLLGGNSNQCSVSPILSTATYDSIPPLDRQ